MNTTDFTPEHEVRTAFYEAMSQMYRQEVPLYGDLLDIVDAVNASSLAAQPELEADLRRRGELDRLGRERHGAIRVGTAAELSMMRRIFAVMGMHPVGYYDLSVAGVPVHSTVFRPIDLESLNRNPFRIFTSLLRLDLIDDAVRLEATRLLSRRTIFSPRAVALVERFEHDGGLNPHAATEFVAEVLETFRWHSDTLTDSVTYARLHGAHRLIADVACFRGPHINHLTPRTLDIDAAQAEMQARGMDAKDVIEGPPRRSVPILLRQTSFKALEEQVLFNDGAGGRPGAHTARFGEIEQRGVALTRKGRALYDSLLENARAAQGCQAADDYQQHLQSEFARFPDDLATLRREDLGYFNYRLATATPPPSASVADLETLISDGVVEASPIIYEDFLPVSAAGVFQSNLGATEQRSYSARQAQDEFENALGAAVADPFELYEAIQRKSLAVVRAELQELSA